MAEIWNALTKADVVAAIATVATAIIAAIALVATWIEYRRQKRSARLELAQGLIDRLETDEMIVFAVKSLDWAGGQIPVPATWRAIVQCESIPPDPHELAAAVEMQLTEKTAQNPVRLLYRHSFVSLFNHLERIEDLRQKNAVKTADLGTMSWLAGELKDWRYDPNPGEPAFRPALDGWYEKGKLFQLIDDLIEHAAKQHIKRATGPGSRDDQPDAQTASDSPPSLPEQISPAG
jgi:hypothetical protein